MVDATGYTPAARLRWRIKRTQKGIWVAGLLAGIMWLLVLVVNGCATRLLGRGEFVPNVLPVLIGTFVITLGIWAAGAWRLPAEGTRRPDKRSAGPAPIPVQRFERHAASAVVPE